MLDTDAILRPTRLWAAGELWLDPTTPPAKSGLYGWYFDEIPPSVPRDECHTWNGRTLLYVGISPARPGSKQHLRMRLRQHYRGNARGSTLRKTLGCLLQGQLRLEYRRTSGSSKSMRFTTDSEARLSAWMAEQASVTWALAPEPWIDEAKLIRDHSLPLNLQGNSAHPFYESLRSMRRAMVSAARNSSPMI